MASAAELFLGGGKGIHSGLNVTAVVAMGQTDLVPKKYDLKLFCNFLVTRLKQASSEKDQCMGYDL